MDPDWTKPFHKRQKDLEPIVYNSVMATLERFKNQPPAISHHLNFGAIGYDPASLAAWFIFNTNAEKAQAASAGLLASIEKTLKDLLVRNGYPAEAVAGIRVEFASHEEIEREGGWKQFFS
jgi:hypothetical protein